MQFKNFYLALCSSLFLSFAWYFDLTAFIFTGFVPLFFIEKYFHENRDIPRRRLKFYGLVYLVFLLWNVGVTWWVYCVQFGKGGAILAFLANAALMTIVFITFSNCKNKLGNSKSIWLFIPIWLAWEHVHTLWDLSWSWLNIGNVFSYRTNWVQWYEYTGASGGTVWALLVNILVFRALSSNAFTWRNFLKPLAAILVPIFVSYGILYTYKNRSELPAQQILVVQPNIDPYNEKFDSDFSVQFIKMLNQIRTKITDSTSFLVLPETFVSDDVNEDFPLREESIKFFYDSLIQKYPDLNIVTGINSYKYYKSGEPTSYTARLDQRTGLYYDYYNSAALLNKNGIQIYHKSKLVPGVELMPFPWLFKPFESLAIEMGGTSGSLGTQESRDVLKATNKIAIAPVICYESIYANYCTGYIRNGANFIFIITNDGWWENTPGHKQHLHYARLRAIEARRAIARSANTGISAFITETGEIEQPQLWWTEAAIKANLKPNNKTTFFVKFGDILSYTAVAMALAVLLYYWFLRFYKR